MKTGQKVAQARAVAGLTREQLSEKSGIPYSTLMKLEQGVTASPRLDDIVKIAIALGMSVDDFVADPPPPVAKSKR